MKVKLIVLPNGNGQLATSRVDDWLGAVISKCCTASEIRAIGRENPASNVGECKGVCAHTLFKGLWTGKPNADVQVPGTQNMGKCLLQV